MEQVARPRKALFVVVFAVLWGGGMALLMWLSHRHDARRVGSVYHVGHVYYIVGDLVIWMLVGLFIGLSMWNSLKRPGHRKVSRNKAIVQNVLFWGLMAFLALLLWKMW